MRKFLLLVLLLCGCGSEELRVMQGVSSTTQMLHVDSVADLANLVPRDNQLCMTAGYEEAGDGAGNLYRYDKQATDTVDNGWVLDGPNGIGRFIAVDRSKANIRLFGANGTDEVDDAAAIQAAFDAISSSGGASGGGGVIYVPAGRYYVETTIDCGNLRGWKMFGDGQHPFDNAPSSSFPQSMSALIWNGADGGTLMTGGFVQSYVEGISFWGAPAEGGDRAGVLIHQTQQVGVGAGTGYFENCAFDNFDIAYKIGSVLADVNLENMTFNHTMATTGDIFFQVNNLQSVNHCFTGLHTVDVARIFEFNAGGDLHVDTLTTVFVEEILQINGGSDGTGDGNSTFVFDQVKIDPQQTVSPTLVKTEAVEAAGNRSVTFRHIRTLSSAFKDDGRYLVDVSGSIDVVVEDCHWLVPTDTILRIDNSFTYNPRVLFERCAVTTNLQPAEWTSAPDFVTVTGGAGGLWGFKSCKCYASTDRVLPEIGNHPSLNSRWGSTLIANAGETTLDVSGVGVVRMINNSPTTLDTLDGGADGQPVFFAFETSNNTIDFTSTLLKGNAGADWNAQNGDSMIATWFNGKWYCDISDNTP